MSKKKLPSEAAETQKKQTKKVAPTLKKEPTKKVMRPGKVDGRPTIYTEELADLICLRIATNTGGLQKLCSKFPDMPHPDTINDWRWTKDGFSAKYLAARANQSHLIIEECETLADDVIYYHDREGNKRIDAPSVAKQMAKINIRKWHASKLAPKFFGDKVEFEHLKNQNEDMMKELLELRAQLTEKNKKEY